MGFLSGFKGLKRVDSGKSKGIPEVEVCVEEVCVEIDAGGDEFKSVESAEDESNGVVDMGLPPTVLSEIMDLAALACVNLRRDGEESDSLWRIWSSKGGLKVETKDECESGSIAGRGIYRHTPKGDYDMDFVSEVMWNEKTKSKYDEHTAAMICMFEVDSDTNVTCQVFKGRFGFSGRDFVMVVHRERVLVPEREILLLGVRSVPCSLIPVCEGMFKSPASRDSYLKYTSTTTRGTIYVAGIMISRNTTTNEYTITYVNDADIHTTGIPKWIVDRVKTDQLSIASNIMNVIEQEWKGRQEGKGKVKA